MNGGDFYENWKTIIGENTYCHRLFEEKIKKTSTNFEADVDFDALNEIIINVVKKDLYQSLCLLFIQNKKIISKLLDSFYDENNNFIDDYSDITYEELEKCILKLGGSPFKVKSFSFTQYNKEMEIVEQKFKTEIAQLKQEQQRLYLENQFLNSHKDDIRQIIKEIIKEEKEKKGMGGRKQKK